MPHSIAFSALIDQWSLTALPSPDTTNLSAALAPYREVLGQLYALQPMLLSQTETSMLRCYLSTGSYVATGKSHRLSSSSARLQLLLIANKLTRTYNRFVGDSIKKPNAAALEEWLRKTPNVMDRTKQSI